MQTNICQLVREIEQDYITGTTTISKYVDWSLKDNVEKIDAYLNSKHTSGLTDSQGREKPFFNIVTSAANVRYRATDIDRKDIRIKPTKRKDTIAAFLGTVHLQAWMRKVNFGQFLNDWGLTLARYGTAVSKFVVVDGTLHPMVIPWNRLIVDSVDIPSNPIIEVLELTPAQLKSRKGYSQNMVDALLDATTARQTLDRQRKDNKGNYIKLYEIHGELPLSYLTGKEEDEKTFVQQMHVVSFVESKEKGEYDDFTLASGREKQPYHVAHLIKEDGRSMGIGAVEHLFESQWMLNHTQKAIKDQLDLASKLVYQTADANFIGQNVLSQVENGDILIHNVNQPLTQVNNNSHDITSLQNFGNQWKSLGNEIVGTSESMLGNNAPSGTAWRQTEALLQESHSLFEIMTENKGLALEEILRTHILPYLKTKMDSKEEIVLTLGDYDISKIEAVYIKNKAVQESNKMIKAQILKGERAQQPDLNAIKGALQEDLNQQGGYRFFKPSETDDKTWKEVFRDFEMDVEVEITGEQTNKQANLTTLNTLFSTLVSLQGRPMSPEQKLVFGEILTSVGTVSPIQLSALETQQPATPHPQQQAPTVNPIGGE